MLRHESKHLSKEEQIKLGSYYTPKELVNAVYDLINPYTKHKKNIIIFDSAAGCGAFVQKNIKQDYRVADYDKMACDFLKNNLEATKVFYSNSLKDVSRKKYNIPKKTFLIMIGNPPYNDTTSEFKNGQKGKNLCDEDLYDRDLGISFLKSYNKLEADIVCILHPLSYLIKEANFNRLKDFKDNYKLKKALVFPSSLFSNTGAIKFPIMIGLYEKNSSGMNYNYIKNFPFSIYKEGGELKLSKFKTTDGHIDKYPPRKNDVKISPLNVYYYTFRDFNSLRKNASFLKGKNYNGIVVTVDNFYKYAYLDSLKNLFKPEKIWLYGNLSPLFNETILENNKKKFIQYTIQNNKNIKNLDKKNIQKITRYYKINLNRLPDIKKLERDINRLFNRLINI